MKKEFDSPELFDETKINGKGRKILPKIFFGVFVAYAVLFVIFMSFFLNFRITFDCVAVKGSSMQPTLNSLTKPQGDEDSEYDLVYITNDKDIQRGDIVVFDAKRQGYDKTQKRLIKRVIALEGEAVTIRKVYDKNLDEEVYKVCVASVEALSDGVLEPSEVEILDEEYTTSKYDWTYKSNKSSVDKFGKYAYEDPFASTFLFSGIEHKIKENVIADTDGVLYSIVPEDNFFYLGDNRSNSSDSRERGTEKINTLTGIVKIIVPNGQNAESSFKQQFSTAYDYYKNMISDFFANLWKNLEKSFAI